ncbi:MAG TPA: hypothetical protein VGK73_05750 [Polyangiaceae bacterium]
MSGTIITLPVRDDVNRRLRESLKASGLPWLPIYGMSDLPRARSLLITRALRLGADAVVFIDADIVATHEQILALSKHPRLRSGGAVTGLYSARGGQAWACDADPDSPEPDGCLLARTAGLGFAVVTRASLLRVGKTLPELEDEGETWRPYCLPFIGEHDGKPKYFAEDIALWKRLSETGTSLWADPALTVGHLTELPIFAPLIQRPSNDTRAPRTKER